MRIAANRTRRVIAGAVIFAATVSVLGQQPPAPTIDEFLSLKRVDAPAIAPDGSRIAFTIRETNWQDNAYETEIWLVGAVGGPPRQLTNAAKSSNAPAWSPDGRLLAFLSDRSARRQLYVIDPSGGEARQITSGEEAVSAFKWSPDSSRIAYVMTDALSPAMKERAGRLGDFDFVDEEHRLAHLHVVDLATNGQTRLTSGALTVGTFDWSPDGAEIAFDHRINGDPANNGSADVSVVASTGNGAVRPLITQPGADTDPVWSPDGRQIGFETSMARADSTYLNRRIAVVPKGGGTITSLTGSFDENPALVAWNRSGILFTGSQRTWSYLFRLDPTTRHITRLAPSEQWITSASSITPDGRMAAIVAATPTTYAEVYALDLQTLDARKLTDMGAHTAKWAQPTREVITWRSQDGTSVEGVLHKPVGFRGGTRHALLVVIHGGPTAVSRPVPFSNHAQYPIEMWLGAGVLVLEPNYRGSAGYGEEFRSLNVRNLGIGDAWDVLSGIDALITLGIIDRDRVGVMGWSQGATSQRSWPRTIVPASRQCR